MKSKVVIWRADGAKKNKEETLNAALEELKDKDIKHVTQSESGTVVANYKITWTIWYVEKGSG